MLINCAYLSVSSILICLLEEMIKMIYDEDDKFHIPGDLNCNNYITNPVNQPTKILKVVLETCQLSPLITQPTRIQANSCTLIGNYITSIPKKMPCLD